MLWPKWAVLTAEGDLESRLGEHTLADLQREVGGYVQHLHGPHGEDLWVNEDGKLEGLPMNEKATEYLRDRGRIFTSDYIAGPMVITGISQKRWEKLRKELM